MYLLVNVCVRSGPDPIPTIRGDLAKCFANVPATEVIWGCIVAHPNKVSDTQELLAHLISLESAYDPQVDIAIFWCANGNRWVVTDPVPETAKATAIVGRAPEVV